jgi:hypothetical protein
MNGRDPTEPPPVPALGAGAKQGNFEIVDLLGRSGMGEVWRAHVVDLKTGRVSALPGSEGMWFLRWSPDGRFIAGFYASWWDRALRF